MHKINIRKMLPTNKLTTIHDNNKASWTNLRFTVAWTLLSLLILGKCHGIVGNLCSSTDLSNNPLRKDWLEPCQQNFSYCHPKKGEIPATCPDKLVLHPGKGKCDRKDICDSTAKRAPRIITTAEVNVEEEFVEGETNIECPNRPCGAYPGDECNTYFICSGGIKVHKTCSGNNVFDYKSKECKDPQQGKCWQVLSTIKPTVDEPKKKDAIICPYHDSPMSKTVDSADPSARSNSTGIILSSPIVTSYGAWLPWVYCASGSYLAGLSIWRRSTDADGTFDHAGVVSVGFKCENPVTKAKASIIGQYAPGAPDDKWFGFLNCEVGVAIGFQLSQQADQGLGDDLATDNIRMYDRLCACGKDRIKAKKYEDTSNPEYVKVGGQRGKWTEAQYCQEKQALCGFRTQMQPWEKEKVVNLKLNDMTGLNQMRFKCCDVDPPSKCIAKEERIFLQICDNRDAAITRRCPFNTTVGVAYNYQKYDTSVAFYESVGFTLEKSLEELHSSVKSGISCGDNDEVCSHNWEMAAPRVFQSGITESSKINVKSGVHVKLFQVVATCGIFTIHTNKVIKIRQDMKGKDLPDDPVMF